APCAITASTSSTCTGRRSSGTYSSGGSKSSATARSSRSRPPRRSSPGSRSTEGSGRRTAGARPPRLRERYRRGPQHFMILADVVRDLFHRRTRDAAELSVVVHFFNNRREARNTLISFTRSYQRGAQDMPYEVIALDNGSTQPLSEAEVRAFGPEFRYRFVPTKSVSPVDALNEGCRDATGEQLLVMVDGAH